MKNIQILDLILVQMQSTIYKSTILIPNYIFSTIKITIDTLVSRIELKKVHFKKMSFEAQYFVMKTRNMKNKYNCCFYRELAMEKIIGFKQR